MTLFEQLAATPLEDHWRQPPHMFAERIGDYLPEVGSERRKKIEIPVKNRARLYMLYRQGVMAETLRGVCRATFYKLLSRADFAYLRFPSKKKANFHKCEACLKLEKALLEARDVLTIAIARRQYAYHLLHMMKERDLYARTKMKASMATPHTVADPYAESVLSLIVDGMDQDKSKLPLVKSRVSDSAKRAPRLPVHIIGLIDHRDVTNSDGYQIILTRGSEWGSDSCATIQVIWNAILAYSNRHGMLPKTLEIQMDNTSKDNKNRHVLAFAAGWFFTKSLSMSASTVWRLDTRMKMWIGYFLGSLLLSLRTLGMLGRSGGASRPSPSWSHVLSELIILLQR